MGSGTGCITETSPGPSPTTPLPEPSFVVARCKQEDCLQTVLNSPGIAYRDNTLIPKDILDSDDIDKLLSVVELI